MFDWLEAAVNPVTRRRGGWDGKPLGGASVMSQVPAWLQIATSIAMTVGVLVALGVVVIWEPRKAREDRRRYDAQMAALQRAEDDRIAAQARKVVPSVNRADIFGQNVWIARVNNTSNGVITDLVVAVTAVDGDGKDVAGGFRQANNELDIAGGSIASSATRWAVLSPAR